MTRKDANACVVIVIIIVDVIAELNSARLYTVCDVKAANRLELKFMSRSNIDAYDRIKVSKFMFSYFINNNRNSF